MGVGTEADPLNLSVRLLIVFGELPASICLLTSWLYHPFNELLNVCFEVINYAIQLINWGRKVGLPSSAVRHASLSYIAYSVRKLDHMQTPFKSTTSL